MTGVDQGRRFGYWADPTSRLIYRDVMPTLLSGVETRGTTLDLGGGNGLSRLWFPGVTTVDTDYTKTPDVVADIRTYVPDFGYDRVLLRYVLHYLPDLQVGRLFKHIARYHDGQLLLIQFVNDDLAAKRANSVNEVKYFRTEEQVVKLLDPWRVVDRVAVEYQVHPDFYRNRLGHPNPTAHPERVVRYVCEQDGAA